MRQIRMARNIRLGIKNLMLHKLPSDEHRRFDTQLNLYVCKGCPVTMSC